MTKSSRRLGIIEKYSVLRTVLLVRRLVVRRGASRSHRHTGSKFLSYPSQCSSRLRAPSLSIKLLYCRQLGVGTQSTFGTEG